MTFLESFLAPFVVGIFANFSTKKVESAIQDINNSNAVLFKKLFTSSMIDTINLQTENSIFNNRYGIFNKLSDAIKDNDEKLFIAIENICYEKQKNFLNIIRENDYAGFIENLFDLYSIDIEEVHDGSIYHVSLQHLLENYQIAFFNNLTKDEAMLLTFNEVLKIDNIVKVLNKIETKVESFDEIRKVLLHYYTKNNPIYVKNRQDYDSYLLRKFEFLELAGFSPKISGKDIFMKLSDVFVPLHIQTEEDLHKNKYLPVSNQELSSIDSILENDALVILGDPGSGKSTLLKYIATHISNNREHDSLLQDIVPVFIRIADYVDWYDTHKVSLYEFIVNSDVQYSDLFKENFEYSNLLILLDGLDEITDNSIRNKIVQNIIDLKSRYPNNKYIVTSRLIGYRESSLNGHFIESKLKDFTETEIKQFSKQWYNSIATTEINSKKGLTPIEKNEITVKYDNLSSELFKSISRNSSVIKFAKNPLLMTIVTMIFYQSKKLPNKRVELYDIATETFLDNWVRMRFEENEKFKDKGTMLEILPNIAFEIHTQSSKGLISENNFKKEFIKLYKEINGVLNHEAKKEFREFKDFLEKYTGFFYRKDIQGDLYGFVHLTFEEYLSALELQSKWDLNELNLNDYIFNPRWVEVIRLAVASLKISNKSKSGRVKATKFINDILETSNDKFPESHRSLQLVLLILADDVEINNDDKINIINEFVKVIENSTHNILVSTLANIFGEILYSLYAEDFLNKLEAAINTEDTLHLKNIFHILLVNSTNIDVKNLILKCINKKKYRYSIFTAFKSLQSFNRNLQLDLTKEDHFKNKLRQLIIENEKLSEKEIKTFFSLYLQLSGFNIFMSDEGSINNFIKAYNEESETKLNNLYYNFFLKFLLHSDENEECISMLNIKSKTLRNNLHKLIEIKDELSFSVKTSYHDGYVLLQGPERKAIVDLKNINIFNVQNNSYIAQSNDYTEEERLRLNDYIKYLNGSANEKSLTSFLECSENKHDHYDFFEWTNYPILNLSFAPDKLSEIILKNLIYYETSISKTRMDRDIYKIINGYLSNKLLFDSLIPPIQLFFLRLIKHTYSENLIDDCIKYFHTIKDEDIKEGVYYLLFISLTASKI